MMISTLPTPSSGQNAPGAAELSSALAGELRSSFGQEAITSGKDPRLTSLHKDWQDVQKTLGPTWQEVDANTWALDNGGNTRQVLTHDVETRLSTSQYVSMTRTISETLVLDQDGKIRKESMTAR
jgi:hypothetical protein